MTVKMENLSAGKSNLRDSPNGLEVSRRQQALSSDQKSLPLASLLYISSGTRLKKSPSDSSPWFRPLKNPSSPFLPKKNSPLKSPLLTLFSPPFLLAASHFLCPRPPTSVSLFSPVPPPSIQPILGLTRR